MKTPEKLRDLYEKELKISLKDVEDIRKKAKKWRIFMIICLVVVFVGLQMFQSNYNPYVTIPVLILGVLGALAFFIIYRIHNQDYRRFFKENIFTKIIHFVNPAYKYEAQKFVPLVHFQKCGLFLDTPSSYTGDDLVSGIIDKTPFMFSELKVRTKRGSGDDEKIVTLFKGLFFVIEFNKKLNESSFVIPEKTHTSMFGKEKSEVKEYGKLIKLENPEFEKIFSVYGSSQQEARYILTPKMMEAMVNLYNICDLQMMFSFIGSKVYCALPISHDLFEPTVMHQIEYSDVEQYYMYLSMIETIIKEMNLNTRIWTKK